MAFAIIDPVLANITNKADVIEKLIKQYPLLLKEWEKETEARLKKEAAEIAEGDSEVELSYYSQSLGVFDDDYQLKDIFYQSMLLITVSYYESVVTLLSKRAGIKDLIMAICKKNKIELSAKTLDDIDFIERKVSVLRNNICHNNSGTLRKTDVLLEIANDSDEIIFQDDTISINGPCFILDALEKEKLILEELADKLGHKNKLLKDGKLISIERK